MKLHYNKLTPTVFSATTAAAGYPATNLGNESVQRPWRATGLLAEDVKLQLPAVATIQTLTVQDVNFASATVEKSVDGAAWVAVGVMTTYADRHGRRRGSITINAAGQLAVRFRIAAGASTDGLAYWRCGSASLFGSVVTLSATADYGYTVNTRRPRVAVELANGSEATATTGPNVDRIELSFPRQNTELIDDLVQKPTAGTCWLDMGLPNYPEQQWPVRCLASNVNETFTKKNLSTLLVSLKEMA